MIHIFTFQGVPWDTSKNKSLRDKKTRVSVLVPMTSCSYSYSLQVPIQLSETSRVEWRVKSPFVIKRKSTCKANRTIGELTQLTHNKY